MSREVHDVLRVVEYSHRTDTGRQRQANEDSFFARAPIFAVADGMGGAQAGEVASRIAAEAFEPAQHTGAEPPETFLRKIAQRANRDIHSLAQRDVTRSGMGTTLTAAMVDGDDVVIGHVGDSRAYRFRDGELKLLTSDHSLVEELRRQGRLTDQQAEDHPQRSIITRALGPEPEVEVDTMTFRARPGDVYLLCSDGLTTMIKEPEIREVLAGSDDLDAVTTELVRRANEAGGKDNITVVAFRVESAEAPAEEEDLTLVGPSAEEAGLTATAVREAARREPEGVLGGAAARPEPRPRTEPAPQPRKRGLRRAIKVFIAAALVAGLIVLGVFGARQVYFLGADEGGRLTLYRGLPYELPLGINLYSEVQSSPVQVSSLPPDRRDAATNHELRGRDDAVDLLEDLEAAAVTAPPRDTQRPSEGRQQRGRDQADGRRSNARGGGGGGSR
jgi:protein phosphatase